MRYLIAVLSLFTCAGAQDFLSPATADYVKYLQKVDISILLREHVATGRIGLGRNAGEAQSLILAGSMTGQRGDTLRVMVTMPAFYPAGTPAERDYSGWARFYLFNETWKILSTVAVQIGTPPVSGTGKVSPIYRSPEVGRSYFGYDVMGRNGNVSPPFSWRYQYGR